MAPQSSRSLPPRLSRRLPEEAEPLWSFLLALARNVGVGITGTRGVGKTTLMFLFSWLDGIVLDKSMVVVTPTPQIINLFFTQTCRLHPADQAAIWPKIRYINLSGQEISPGSPPSEWYVSPTPVYYQAGVGAESTVTISQRFPEALLRLEPSLADRTATGYRPLLHIAGRAGRILHTLGLSVIEMTDLLTFPEAPRWERRFAEALRKDPSLADAVSFFRDEYRKWTPGRRDERANTLLTRLSLFDDDVMKAQFGAASMGVPWKDVLDKRLKVFIDVSQEHNEEAKKFKMLWVFLSLIDFVKRYGAQSGGDRSNPLSLIVDEISTILGKGSALNQDIDQFVNVYSRNYNCELVTSFQEPYQLEDVKSLETLLSLGTKFYGRMTDPRSSRLIADYAVPYDPYKVKEVVYHRVGGARGWDVPRNVYYTKDEQNELARQGFDNLGIGEFLVSRTINEGDKPLPLQRYSIKPFRIRQPDRRVVADAKRRLAKRDGVKVGDVLAAIKTRQAEDPLPRPDDRDAAPPAAPRWVELP